eukprot:UN15057
MYNKHNRHLDLYNKFHAHTHDANHSKVEKEQQHNIIALIRPGPAAVSSFSVHPLMVAPPHVLPDREEQIQDVVVDGAHAGHDEVPARGRPIPWIEQPKEQTYH